MLAIVDGNISRASAAVGMTRPTLYDLMDRYGVRSPARPSKADRCERRSLSSAACSAAPPSRVLRRSRTGSACSVSPRSGRLQRTGPLLADRLRLPSRLPDAAVSSLVLMCAPADRREFDTAASSGGGRARAGGRGLGDCLSRQQRDDQQLLAPAVILLPSLRLGREVATRVAPPVAYMY